MVLGNETQLTQVLTNLVNNAIEAMLNGGTIRIELSSSANNVIVKVSDTGLGMSDDDMRRCFVTYFTTRTNGSGLGLSVCRRIVEDHQGSIVPIHLHPDAVIRSDASESELNLALNKLGLQ